MADFKQAFVAGWPIKHSRSPLIHKYWLNHHGLQGDYQQMPVEPDKFSSFLSSLPNSRFAGGNVTIPYKETAAKLVDHLEDSARRIGAVNTVWMEGGRLFGANTDGHGFLTNLDQSSPGWDNDAARNRGVLVLGAGGASRAVVDGLFQRGFEKMFIANRTIERAESLRDELAPTAKVLNYLAIGKAEKQVSIVVNTTSIGMGDGKAPISLAGFRPDTLVNDIIYAPLFTPLLIDARERGMTAADGLGMLLHQAVPGFEKWFGPRPQVTTELRNLILKDLGETQ